MGDFIKYVSDQLRSREMWARLYELNTPAHTKEERRARRSMVLGKADIVPLALTFLPLTLLPLLSIIISTGSFEHSWVLGVIGGALIAGSEMLLLIISSRIKAQIPAPAKEKPSEEGARTMNKIMPFMPVIMTLSLFAIVTGLLGHLPPPLGLAFFGGMLVLDLGFLIAVKRKKSKNHSPEKGAS